jgi:acetyl/propionyl-CoA carboxylase alpha subunit
MLSALRDYVILGCTTAIPFLLDVLEHPSFSAGDTHTHFIEEHLTPWSGRERHRLAAILAAAIDAARPQSRASREVAGTVQITPWNTLGPWRLGGD